MGILWIGRSHQGEEYRRRKPPSKSAIGDEEGANREYATSHGLRDTVNTALLMREISVKENKNRYL